MLKVKRKRGITGSVGARLVAAPLGLVAVTLLAGGIRLVMLGGSPYYLLAGLACLCRELPLGPPEVPLAPFYLRETDAEVHFPQASSHLSEAQSRGQAR